MKSKKVIVSILAIALAVQVPTTALAKNQYPTYQEYQSGADKAETQEYSVIEIATEADLAQLAENCKLDSWSVDKHVKLTADIVLKEYAQLSIPSFGGIFDGGGYSITDLRVTGTGSAAGLFRYIQKSGTVRNLNVVGKVIPDGSQSQVGGIAGHNYGAIINCSFSGQVVGDSEVGGIAGVNEKSGEIRQCSSDASVTGNHSAGGIVGNNHGTINHCDNKGDINTYSTEVAYDLEDITLDNLEDLNSTDNVAAHTDSGGIAGISDGKIYYCSNSGTIGYQHVGYNAGGIVGRLHQGYIQNCTNTGHVLGRKDVGGIAGQMEPFLEIQYLSDKLGELDRESRKFLDMLDATQKDLSNYGKQASTLSKAISANLKNANAAGNALTGTANDLWYIYNNELTGLNQDLKTLGKEWGDLADADKNNSQNNGSQGNDAQNGNNQGNGSQGNDSQNSGNQSNGGNKMDISDITVSGGDLLPGNDWNGQIPGTTDYESYLSALRKFGDSATTRVDTVTKATNDRSGGIRDNLNTFNKELDAAATNLQKLSDVLEQGTDTNSAHMDELVEQARVLRNLAEEIRDDLFRYEGISIEDTSDESASTSQEDNNPGAGTESGDNTSGTDAENEGDSSKNGAEMDDEAYYDTTSFQQGKLTLCVNKGTVEADTNVGGIVGQIATEYDFDPEDDVTLSGAESFDVEQTIRAVVRDSTNRGAVTAKKDCAGGIVGKAEHGAIISCESYGNVESTGGSNVGGIAGSSSYAIRSCYAMGSISGKNNIGGIAGKGCDIFYSYSYTEPGGTGECVGTVAGSLAEDGTLYGNYYVEGTAGGIDGIGYSGGATPVSYEEFCKMEGVPEAFLRFTVTFVADGLEIASYQCGYGEALPEDKIPAVPSKDGYYGEWPEFDFDCVTANRVLEADYEPWITTLASEEKSEDGKSKVLVQGKFRPGQELTLTQEGDEITFAISGEDSGDYEVRVWCDDTDKTKIEVLKDGTFSETDVKAIGSYLSFAMEEQGTFRVTAQEKHSAVIWYAAGTGVVLLVALILLIKAARKRKKNKKSKMQEQEQNSGQSPEQNAE